MRAQLGTFLFRIGTVALLSTACSGVRAEFAVYTQYTDLVNGTPRLYPRFKFHAQKGESDVRIVLQDSVDRSKLEVNCAEIWGFAYEGMLFRVIRHGAYYKGERKNFPAALVHGEGLCYWANGSFLDNTKNPQWWSALDDTYTGFVSEAPDGDVFMAHGHGKVPKDAQLQEMGDRFFTDHPEFAWLQECVTVRVQLKKDLTAYPHQFALHCITQHYRREED